MGERASGCGNYAARASVPDEGPHLEQQAIPCAAISHCTNRFPLENIPWESKLDSACSVESFHLFGGELQIQTGEIVLELSQLPRANDRDHRHRSIPQPGECNLRHAATGLFGDRLHRRDNACSALFLRKKLLHSLIAHPPSIG